MYWKLWLFICLSVIYVVCVSLQKTQNNFIPHFSNLKFFHFSGANIVYHRPILSFDPMYFTVTYFPEAYLLAINRNHE